MSAGFECHRMTGRGGRRWGGRLAESPNAAGQDVAENHCHVLNVRSLPARMGG